MTISYLQTLYLRTRGGRDINDVIQDQDSDPYILMGNGEEKNEKIGIKNEKKIDQNYSLDTVNGREYFKARKNVITG